MPYRYALIFFYPILGLVLWITTGCGRLNTERVDIPQTTESEACEEGSAQILVGTNYLKNLCGCTGPGENGALFLPQQGPLSCHLQQSSGKVFFIFPPPTLEHQLVLSSLAEFFTIPYIGTSATMTSVYGVELTGGPRIYSFHDAFSPLSGEISLP